MKNKIRQTTSGQVSVYKPEQKLQLIRQEARNISKIEDILKHESHQLSWNVKNNGKEEVEKILASLIIEFVEFAGVKNNITPDAVKKMINLICEEYYYLKYIDIRYIFRKAELGHYGHLYKSLDSLTVMNWFKDYDKERWEVMDNQAIEKHDKFRKQQKITTERTKWK